MEEKNKDKIMTVHFNGLQRNAVRSYNDLIKIVEESPMIANGSAGTHKLLEVHDLSEALGRLREDILVLACLIPPGGKDISDEPGFELKFFEVPEEEEEEEAHDCPINDRTVHGLYRTDSGMGGRV